MRELSGILWQKLYKSMQRYPHNEEYENEFYKFIHIFQSLYPQWQTTELFYFRQGSG